MKSAIENVKIGRPATVLKNGKTVTQARKDAAADRSAAKKLFSIAIKTEKVAEKQRYKAQKATMKAGANLARLKDRVKWKSKEEKKTVLAAATEAFKAAKASEKAADRNFSDALKTSDLAAKTLAKADEAIAKIEAEIEKKAK